MIVIYDVDENALLDVIEKEISRQLSQDFEVLITGLQSEGSLPPQTSQLAQAS